MTRYKYKGDFAVITIDKTDYVLVKGKEIELPENSSKVKQFLKQGKLIQTKKKGAK